MEFPGGQGVRNLCFWALLVAQWIGIHLPVQGTQVWSLVRELKSHMSQSNWACVLQLPKPVCRRACAPQQEKPPQWEACAPDREQPLLATARESLHAATKTQCNEINKYIVLKKKERKKSVLPLQGVQVRYLVGELRSHVPCGAAKYINKIKKKEV